MKERNVPPNPIPWGEEEVYGSGWKLDLA